MILLQLERIARATTIDRIVVATSVDPSDDGLATLLAEAGHAVYRGPLDDVLERFGGALETFPAKSVVRLTGDCPLADPAVIDAAARRHLETAADYTSNALHPTFADGLDVEVVRADVLQVARREAVLRSEREHVTPFIWSRPERFRLAELASAVDRSSLRWTVDTPDDLRFVTAVFEALYPVNPAFGSDDIIALLDARPDLAATTGAIRNEGYVRSLAADARSRPEGG